MGSHKLYRIILIFVLVFLAATAGRLHAQEDNVPIPPEGALGEPPTQPVEPTVGSPPVEVPDSPPAIDHPPENEAAPPQEEGVEPITTAITTSTAVTSTYKAKLVTPEIFSWHKKGILR